MPNGLKHLKIFTDGACIGNPGPGGYGAVLLYKTYRKEITGGYRHTTNNRMEIMAAIKGLETLKEPCQITLFSDSQYLVKAIAEGWAQRWKATGWRRNKKEAALNPDLWDRLLSLCDVHDVTFEWVRGHAGDQENERCDFLANEAALRRDLPPDDEYELLGRKKARPRGLPAADASLNPSSAAAKGTPA